MNDTRKTREELLEELTIARRRITQLEQAAEQSERDRDLLRALMARIPDYVYFKDRNRRFVRASDSFCDLFGCTMDEIIGKTDEELFPPEIVQHSIADDRRVIETGIPIVNQIEGGRTIGEAQLYVLTTKLPWRDAEGNIIGLFGISRDITERKQALEALRESEERFRLLSTCSPMGVFYTDQDGRVLYTNPRWQEIAGMDFEESLGFGWIAALHPDDRESVLAEWAQVLAQHTGYHGEFRFQTPDSGVRWVRTITQPLRDDSGVVIGHVGANEDVTERRRAEADLRLLETIVFCSTDILALLDIDYTYQAVNQAYVRAFGKQVDEVVGHKPAEIFGPEFFEETIRPRAERCLAGEEVHYREWFDLPSLGLRHLDVIYSPYSDSQGEMRGFVVAARDITEQKVAEEALRESEEKYRAITESALDSIFCKDLDSRYTFVNRAMEQLFQIPAAELVGLTPRELFGEEGAAIVDAVDAPVFRGEVSNAVRTLRIRDEDRTFHTIQVPLRGAGGEVTGISGIVRDITEQQRAAEALRESLEFNRTILSASPVGISTYRADGQCLSSNEAIAVMVGATMEEVLAQNFNEIESWRKSGLVEDARACLSDGVGRRRQVHVRSTFGREVWLECQFARFSIGNQPHIILLVDDITERVQAQEERLNLEAQVQHAEKLKSLGVLAGGIAHDFNNMLCGILGNADLAIYNIPSHSPVRKNLEAIASTARKCAELTRQMLDYSGKGNLAVEKINLRSLVEEMKGLLQSCVSKKSTFEIDVPDGLAAIKADASQIRQIIMNLVINASEALGGKSGRIALTIRSGTWEKNRPSQDWVLGAGEFPEGPCVVIEVSDTGCGMDAETRAKIFDPFFTTKFTGRGLGLAALHGVVRAHKGGIELESEPGKGSNFRVFLPALEQAAAPAVNRDEADADWRGSGTILLADDEEAARSVAQQMLERLGFAVLTAVNGQEAVEVFQEHDADIVCVLLDLTMPLMSGEEAFAKLRELRGDLPVLLSSGFTGKEATDRLNPHGLAGFIQKPYDLVSLRHTLQEVLLGRPVSS